MADKQELEITIDDEGNVQIKVIGAAGPSCLDLTKDIEAALGVVTDRQRTSDFYQQPQEQRGTIEQGG